MQSKGIGNAFILTWRHWQCLHFEQKSMWMLVILTWRHCQCLPFHLRWQIFTYYRNDNASRLRRSHRNNSQTRHSRPIWIPHSSLVASPLVTRGESKWAFVTRWELFFPFTCGKPLVKGKSPCLRLSLKALRHSSIYTVNMETQNINRESKNHVNGGYLVVLKGRNIG